MLEILAPAGNYESALAAIHNGANAIYLGFSSSFSARQGAENFEAESFREILLQAHLRDVRVYVALNTVIKTSGGELDNFINDVLFAWNQGADAIILQDPFLGKMIHEAYPEIVLHLSTQAGVCNLEGARFAKECGFSRVILARETPLTEISKIAALIETETFVQGALCTCFSGQCYFSSFAGGNSGNRGRCKQPCRKLYAYDRNGNEQLNYALSLSDLCVGENIEKLIDTGVVSFKIEGRMRRAEYVASAVRYYRAILDNANTEEKLSDLKRTYNRGNYTKGLAFGQDKRLLSTSIQGHLGEKVGVVKVLNKNYFVESPFRPSKGDAFKILRDGQEIGGAFFVQTQTKGFVIDSKPRLKNGDSVFITTDTAVNKRVLSGNIPTSVSISLLFEIGKTALATWNGITVESDSILQPAQNRPLSEEEVSVCFAKTDGLFSNVSLDISISGNIFIPKSELNAFRRKVYAAICEHIQKGVRGLLSAYVLINNLKGSGIAKPLQGKNKKVAVLSDDFTAVEADIAIYKPKNYCLPLPEDFLQGNFEKYIYYPAFATQEDLTAVKSWISDDRIDGIYAENYGGIVFAREHGKKIFAGTGFNLTNEYSLRQLLCHNEVAYYAISKELNAEEAASLASERSFVLASGNIKIMDLCYCPFGKTCRQCDQKEVYRLTDENGRVFPVRRYLAANGDCRFEVYNCADLIGKGIKAAGQLLDLTLILDKHTAIQIKDDEMQQKSFYKNYTSGHYKRGVQ